MDESFYETFGKIIAIIFLIVIPLHFFRITIWTYFISPRIFRRGGENYITPEKDSWVIVTGATDGIGLEFARQLAGKGYNICLISRNPEKLEKTRETIVKDFPGCGKVITIPFDFSSTNYDSLTQSINKLPRIDILINNVGVVPNGSSLPNYFTSIPRAKILQGININIFACTYLTSLALCRMRSQIGGPNMIINVSSIFGCFVKPLYTLYCSTKVFMNFFSRSLRFECFEENVDVHCLNTGPVATNITPTSMNFLVPGPYDYVKMVLSCIGYHSHLVGYWVHELLLWLAIWIPIFSLYPDTSDRQGTRLLALLREQIYRYLEIPNSGCASKDTKFDLMSAILLVRGNPINIGKYAGKSPAATPRY
ncbi:very-long-chain 3-oxoacyl-CoA reductase-like [Brevipalpus obovatus]|uniref:very-long-chain 3-oxoacyl-CoA reductase-like n=1 Tax=Brevipalpus obovatus TaxID=246614 RepID=UPI003D9EE645